MNLHGSRTQESFGRNLSQEICLNLLSQNHHLRRLQQSHHIIPDLQMKIRCQVRCDDGGQAVLSDTDRLRHYHLALPKEGVLKRTLSKIHQKTSPVILHL